MAPSKQSRKQRHSVTISLKKVIYVKVITNSLNNGNNQFKRIKVCIIELKRYNIDIVFL